MRSSDGLPSIGNSTTEADSGLASTSHSGGGGGIASTRHAPEQAWAFIRASDDLEQPAKRGCGLQR